MKYFVCMLILLSSYPPDIYCQGDTRNLDNRLVGDWLSHQTVKANNYLFKVSSDSIQSEFFRYWARYQIVANDIYITYVDNRLGKPRRESDVSIFTIDKLTSDTLIITSRNEKAQREVSRITGSPRKHSMTLYNRTSITKNIVFDSLTLDWHSPSVTLSEYYVQEINLRILLESDGTFKLRKTSILDNSRSAVRSSEHQPLMDGDYFGKLSPSRMNLVTQILNSSNIYRINIDRDFGRRSMSLHQRPSVIKIFQGGNEIASLSATHYPATLSPLVDEILSLYDKVQESQSKRIKQ